MDDRTIARWRMHSLRLTGQTYPVALLRDLAEDEHAALAEAADRYGAFLGREPNLRV